MSREGVNLTFNERFVEQQPLSVIKNDENVYKNYVINQNLDLQTENKKIILEKVDLERKIEELEEESDTSDKRLINTKEFLKSYRFMNDALSKSVNEYEKFNNEYNINSILMYFRLFLGSFCILNIACIFFELTYFILIPLQIVFVTGFHEFFVPYLKNIEQKRIKISKIKLEKDKEVEEMVRTMDIVSEFIDNGL